MANNDLSFRIGAVDAASAVLRKVRGELGGLGKEAGTLKSVFGALAPSIAGAFSGAGLVLLAKNTLQGIDNLNDLADATGATVEKLSALEDVALSTGSSLSVATDVVIKLSKALDDATPDNGLGQAFKALGLDVAELRKLDPADMTLKVAQALSKYADDGNKARIVRELLNKLSKEGAAFLKDLAEKEKLVGTITGETTAEVEKLNREFAKLQKEFIGFSRGIAAYVVPRLNDFIDKAREANKEGRLLSFLTARFQGEADGNRRISGGKIDNGPEADRPSAPMIESEEERSKRKEREREANAAYKKLLADRQKLRVDAAEAAAKVDEESARDSAEAWKFWEEEKMRVSKERADAYTLQWKQVFETIDKEQEDAIAEGETYLGSLKKTGKDVGDELALVFSSAAGEAIANFKDLRSVLKGVLADIAQIALRQLITKPLESSLGEIFKGVNLASIFGGPRASGGPVSAGSAYLVGERGPELFLPRTSGQILPNGSGMAAPTIINNIDARTDQAQVAAMVAAGVQQGLQAYARMQRAQGVA